MKRLAPLCLIFMTACGGAKIREQQAQIEELQTAAGSLRGQIQEKQDKIAALEGERADLAAKLEAAQARIDSLVKSNAGLSKAMEANKGELAGQLKEALAENDRLSGQLNDAHKLRISIERAKATLAAQREKTLAELAALRQRHDELKQRNDELGKELGALKGAEKARSRERTEQLAKTREDMGVLADAVLKELQTGGAKIAQEGSAVRLTLQEPLLFEENKAKLTDRGVALMDRLGRSLNALGPRAVRVEGHSDNSRIKWELFGGFTSHWELSASRATAVARYLHEHAGLKPAHLTATGYGEFRPVKGNDTPEGRAANRRVVLVVEPLEP